MKQTGTKPNHRESKQFGQIMYIVYKPHHITRIKIHIAIPILINDSGKFLFCCYCSISSEFSTYLKPFFLCISHCHRPPTSIQCFSKYLYEHESKVKKKVGTAEQNFPLCQNDREEKTSFLLIPLFTQNFAADVISSRRKFNLRPQRFYKLPVEKRATIK